MPCEMAQRRQFEWHGRSSSPINAGRSLMQGSGQTRPLADVHEGQAQLQLQTVAAPDATDRVVVPKPRWSASVRVLQWVTLMSLAVQRGVHDSRLHPTCAARHDEAYRCHRPDQFNRRPPASRDLALECPVCTREALDPMRRECPKRSPESSPAKQCISLGPDTDRAGRAMSAGPVTPEPRVRTP